MEEFKIDDNLALGLSILSSNKILILAINISEDCLTEVMIVRVIVDCEILTLTKVLLFTLWDNVNHCSDSDINLCYVGRHLELNLILFLVRKFDIFVRLWYSDIVNLVHRLQSDLCLLKKSQISQFSFVQYQSRLYKDLCSTYLLFFQNQSYRFPIITDSLWRIKLA